MTCTHEKMIFGNPQCLECGQRHPIGFDCVADKKARHKAFMDAVARAEGTRPTPSCTTCNGTGEVSCGKLHTNNAFEEVVSPCPDCVPGHAAKQMERGVEEMRAENERLEKENAALRQHCADLHNLHRHRFSAAVDKAVDELFKEASWPRAALFEGEET